MITQVAKVSELSAHMGPVLSANHLLDIAKQKLYITRRSSYKAWIDANGHLTSDHPALTFLKRAPTAPKAAFRIALRFRNLTTIDIPSGTSVFLLSHNLGIVVLDHLQKKAIKITQGHLDRHKLETEARLAQQSPLAPHLVEFGHNHNYSFLVTEACFNESPVVPKELDHFSKQQLAPALLSHYTRFKSASRPLSKSLDDLASEASPYLRSTELWHNLVSSLKQNVKSLSDPIIYYVQVHGDCSIKHIHRNSNGWKLIDWGNSDQGNALEDWLSLELKSEKTRWQKWSLLKHATSSSTFSDFNDGLLLSWPGPIYRSFYPPSPDDFVFFRARFIFSLIERLIRIERFTSRRPTDIAWLVKALRS